MKPGEVSELLQIPPSTLRYYTTKYAEYLSASARRGRRRNYTNSDITTLAQIRELANQGQGMDLIKTQLAEVIQHDTQETTLATLPGVVAALDQIKTRLADVDELRQRLDALQQQLDEIQADRRQNWLQRILKRK